MALTQTNKRWLFGLAAIAGGLALMGINLLPAFFQTTIVRAFIGFLTLLTGFNVIQRDI